VGLHFDSNRPMTLSVSYRASNAGSLDLTTVEQPSRSTAGQPVKIMANPRVSTTEAAAVQMVVFNGDTGNLACELAVGCPAPSTEWSDHGETGNDHVTGRSTVVIKMPDGAPYPGDLIEDILEYRKHRAFQLSQSPDFDEARFQQLEDRLRSVPDGDHLSSIRAYHRFDFTFEAKLRFVSEDDEVSLVNVRTVNVSAGGVKVQLDCLRPAGERVWLLVAHRGSVFVLPARIAWSRDTSAGLMFAGAPTTAKRMKARQS